MGEPEEPLALCDCCGEHIKDQPWVGLGRWAIGTGHNRSLHRYVCVDDGEELWDMGTDGAQDDVWAGVILCWPACFHSWIEARMVEIDYKASLRSGGDG